MSLKILVVDPIDQKALSSLQERYDVHIDFCPSYERLKTLIKDFDALIMRSSVTIDQDVINHAPRLKLIARSGSGIDNIDIATARQKKITVFRVPSTSSQSVAEFSLGLIFTLCRNIGLADRQIRNNIWKKSELYGIELQKKNIGIFGFGDIGSKLANLTKSIGMSVKICPKNHSDTRRQNFIKDGYDLCDADTIFETCDIICFCIPLNAETENMIGMNEIKKMKQNPFLINVSRAGIMDHGAILTALESEMIDGFATDVLPQERKDTIFKNFDNVVLTPHIGAMTTEAQQKIGQKVLEGIEAYLKGHDIENKVC